MRIILLFLIFISNFLPSYSKTLYLEKEYQAIWCEANKGAAEYRLEDGARVDCVTQTHAIEFDFAHKWAESIGQSLYYSQMLCKKPGIVIIVENSQKDQRFLKRLHHVTDLHNITVWVMTPNDLRLSPLYSNR